MTQQIESNETIVLHNLIEGGFDFGLTDYEVIDDDYRIRLNNKILEHYRFYEIGCETPAMFKHYLNVALNEIMPYYNQLIQSQLLTINPLLSFEKVYTSNKTNDLNVTNNVVGTATKNVDGTVNKDVVSDVSQDITNTTSLDNTTTSVVDETQVKNSDVSQNSTTNSDKDRSVTNNKDNQSTFSDTPQALLTDANILDNKYATNVTIGDETDTAVEDETIVSTEGIVKDEDTTTQIDSTTTNTSDTDSVSTTDNNTGTVTSDDTITNVAETQNNEVDTTTSQDMVEVMQITENGFNVSLSDLLIRYRDTFINPDVEIVEHVKVRDCFMLKF